MSPFTPKPAHHTEGGHQFSNVFRPDGELLCRFFGDDHKQNAEDFCDVFAQVQYERLRALLPRVIERVEQDIFEKLKKDGLILALPEQTSPPARLYKHLTDEKGAE